MEIGYLILFTNNNKNKSHIPQIFSKAFVIEHIFFPAKINIYKI